jgi:hypothetical protein
MVGLSSAQLRSLFVVALVAATGCSAGPSGSRGGGGDGGGDAGADSAPMDAPLNSYCENASSWIHLLTFTWVTEPVLGVSPGVSRADIVRFEPDSGALIPLGELTCPGAEGVSSMAIDRDGYAWVYYAGTPGLFRVNLSDLSCQTTAFNPATDNFGHMGMAFVAESPTAAEETLFVSGRIPSDDDQGQIATLNTTTFDIDLRGNIPKFGELTGNALGELWAFRATRSPRAVYELDKATGAALQTFDVESIDTDTSIGASGYAFAFWGGFYYMFYRSAEKHSNDPETTSGIWRLDPATGDITTITEDSGYNIVGAGVSTCAPVVIL